ncbi:MAG: GMC family oxidoreductase N-terminal domain-containing protein [Alphaproteobacteria bacterium]|nr:GMC family oxidoreductase N-terminal domain-containing protein [Alphaproteobacteria bacterium]
MSLEVNKYDFIIIGAGSSGATIANRLSENLNISVLLIEAGKKEHLFAQMPMSFGLFINKPGVNWRYSSEGEAGTFNRNIPIPRGKMTGGSSSINGMVYVRGQSLDYDTWAQHGNKGWGWQEVSKIFKKIENYKNSETGHRGNNGLLGISEVKDENLLYDALIRSAQSLGYPLNKDYNGPNQEGIARIQATISNGRRMSTDYCYLRPALKRPNLTLITKATTEKLIIDNKVCKGIIYKKSNKLHKVYCNNEVILSAGAIASPQILELSGIGNEDILNKYEIQVKHNLPAVGEHFQDHFMARLQWKLKLKKASYNYLGRGINKYNEIAKYILRKKGLFSMPAASIIAFLKTQNYLESPDIQIQYIPFSVGSLKKRIFHDFPGMAAACYQLRPNSMGSIHICSPDPYKHPSIKFNFLSHDLDKRVLINAVKIMRNIVEAKPMDLIRDFEHSPGASVSTDDEIEQYIRETAETGFHPSGTCRMGPGSNSVVNDELKIHGLNGIRVADASIFPTIPSGNTNAACIMVGEKVSELIKESINSGG